MRLLPKAFSRLIGLAGALMASHAYPQSAVFQFPKDPTSEQIFRARIFEEPLVSVGGVPSAQENARFAEALNEFMRRSETENYNSLEKYAASYPDSKWNASLECNLGGYYYRAGRFTKAIEAWRKGWELSKAETGENGRAVADRALGEYLRMIARLGKYAELESLLKETETRDIRGPATEWVQGAREGLWTMNRHPEVAFRCGPYALRNVFSQVMPGKPNPSAIQQFMSTKNGTSLWQVRSVSRRVGLRYEAAKRNPGAALPVPCIIHWKVGHYAAVVGRSGGKYHIQDPTFGDDLWITPETIDSEGSGYFLIPANQSTKRGWRTVKEGEAGSVWGKGFISSSDGNSTTSEDPGTSPPTCNTGMPVYRWHLQLVNLNLSDIPIGYTPPRGPAIQFQVTYNHREPGHPSIFNYGNLGNKWNFGWLSYLKDNPGFASADILLNYSGGGIEKYQGFDSASASFATSLLSQASLVRTSISPIKYERRLPDGGVEYFETSDGGAGSDRNVFITRKTDPQGQSITFTYDSLFRITRVTDALNQQTTLTYGLSSDPLKVTRVTDPFERYATFEYNAANQLSKITDVLGLSTQFTYGNGDFISSMTTPYGTTTFRAGTNNLSSAYYMRWGEVTDPLGQRERLETWFLPENFTDTLPVPEGFNNNVSFNPFHEAMTFYWDKKAAAEGIEDFRKAKNFIWARKYELSTQASSIIVAEKDPLESRIWYQYFNQASMNYVVPGMYNKPTDVGRLLDNGMTQRFQYGYNSRGNIIKITDPSGRSTSYGYSTNGLDILTVRQTTGTLNEYLESYTYNTQHLPLTRIDAAGQTTNYAYNSAGQLVRVINPKQDTTGFTYNSSGYLTKIQGPRAGDSTTFVYDTFGRVQKRRNPDGYALQYAYDAMDRVTRITYPDNTFEEMAYNKLDLEAQTDRLGRTTRTIHNAIRQPIIIQDPLLRVTNLEWCACGSLKSLTDPAGNKTQWKRDLGGRVTEKTFADGKKIQYQYEDSTSRLKSRTDAKGQVAHYSYGKDDNLLQVSYTNTGVTTPTVSYAYDSLYDRLHTMTDTTGVTTYTYHPITTTPALGAGRLSKIDGPFANDTITFAYDQLGRLATRAINGSGTSWTYDNLGRDSTESNPLGTFGYAYVGTMDRLQSVLYPNGQKTEFLYFDSLGDFRLKQIKNLTPSLSPLSKFDYTYGVTGQIKTWTQQADAATPSVHNLFYDPDDQLTDDVVLNTGTGAALKQYAYAYDKAGNRTSVQESGAVNKFAYNSLNQLTGRSPGGKMHFIGTVNEPAIVSVNSQGATVSPDFLFTGTANVAGGSTPDTVTVVARDYSNNSRTNRYAVTGTGSGEGSYTYDFNGNLVGAYPATLEWDAEDRLRAVVTGALRSEFTYDGLGRRVRIVEKNGSTVTSDKRFLWVGNEIAEERDASGGTVNKRYFSNGVLIGSSKYFYTKDHLGSIREATDNSGNILARYEYDPYGTRTRVSGAADADFGFTGHYLHVPSGLYLTKYRAYAPGLGRWISRDPIGERGGINLYGYVENNPSNDVDLLGLQGPAGAAWSMACRYVPPVFDKGNAAVAAAAAAAAAAASEAGKWAGGIWSDAGADAGPAASDNSDPTPDPTKAAPSDATGTDSGARSKWGQDAADQYDEITKAQGEAKKKRPKINDKNGEWDGAKKRPKQNKINSTGKSKGRPL